MPPIDDLTASKDDDDDEDDDVRLGEQLILAVGEIRNDTGQNAGFSAGPGLKFRERSSVVTDVITAIVPLFPARFGCVYTGESKCQISGISFSTL